MDGASTCASCLAALPVPEAVAGKTDPHAPNVRKLKIFYNILLTRWNIFAIVNRKMKNIGTDLFIMHSMRYNAS